MLRFKRKSPLCFVAFFSFYTALSTGQATKDAATETNPAFRAGGLSFHLPAPQKDLFEAGPDYRVVLEPLAPESNRLIAAFVTADVLPMLRTGNLPTLRDYALVEIPRRAEFVDVDADSFKQIADGLGKQLGADLNGNIKESQEELDLRLKALGSAGTVTLDKPLPLGLFFSKKDACGYGMVISVTTKDATVQMAMALSVIRVHNRVLFAYFYTRYQGPNTVTQLRTTDEQWADAILDANR